MKAEFINPILSACRSIIKILMFEEIQLGELNLVHRHVLGESISFVFWLTGDFNGRFILSMDRRTALHVAGRMIGEPVETLDEMSKSAVGELASMILGRSGILYAERGLDVRISPPTILEGKSLTISPLGSRILKIPLHLANEDKLDVRIEQQEARQGA